MAEERQRGQGLLVDPLPLEDPQQLLGKTLDLARAALLQIEGRQLQAHQSEVIGDLLAEEDLAHLGQRRDCLLLTP